MDLDIVFEWIGKLTTMYWFGLLLKYILKKTGLSKKYKFFRVDDKDSQT